MELNEVVLAGVNCIDTGLPDYNPIQRVPVIVTGAKDVCTLMSFLPALMILVVDWLAD